MLTHTLSLPPSVAHFHIPKKMLYLHTHTLFEKISTPHLPFNNK